MNLSNNSIGDKFSAQGEVHIKVKSLDGSIVDEIVDTNLIVKTGRQEIVKLLSGDSDMAIKFLGVGNGGARNQDGVAVPIPPKTDDTGLGNKLDMIEVSGFTLDLEAARPAVTFGATIDSADIDSDINELGLFFGDSSTMFSKKTFRTIPFDIDSNLSMEIDWKIVF